MTHKILQAFEIEIDYLIPLRRPNLSLFFFQNNLMYFDTQTDARMRMKEIGKINKYSNPAKSQKKKLSNVNVFVITVVVRAIGMVAEGLERRQKAFEIRGRIDTIQNTALITSARILRRVLETWEELLSLRLKGKKH